MQRPLLQAPFLPPKPPPPIIHIPEPAAGEGRGPGALFHEPLCADVVFRLPGGHQLFAHRVYLATACSRFYDLFALDLGDEPAGGKEPAGRTKSLDAADQGCLATATQAVPLRPSQSDEPLCAPRMPRPASGWGRGIVDVQQERVRDPVTQQEKPMTAVYLEEPVQLGPFKVVLEYLYTGRLDQPQASLMQVAAMAELLEVFDLRMMVANVLNKESFMNREITKAFHVRRANRIKECLSKGSFADVVFLVDDGSVPAHKPLLLAGCDFMVAMFGGTFRESCAAEVSLPGTNCACLRAVLEFLYTELFVPSPDLDAMELLELTNRLCLTRLQALTVRSGRAAACQPSAGGNRCPGDPLPGNDTVPQRSPAGCLVPSLHLHQLQQCLPAVPPRDEGPVSREQGLLREPPLAPHLVPEGGGPLPAHAEGAGAGGGGSPPQAASAQQVVLLAPPPAPPRLLSRDPGCVCVCV
ncbi:rho-related BTB domain-containing protein 2-like isoform X2 [Notechis scutatus]|uniref:Rho-related BTB domain-containing protein 2-like isoform X2 n=1 Tax=Notechis scutatus TaxID=8663 RepID=A0A6J1W222_9SAUR|nr:rho-related BTB domain-containing protein 2-like isoform X2 [Notechis scutatus]XP_026549364.1 rho-related BTB domain-containing protein 2-like isoform X2 [Notechis scutatus]